MTTPSIEAARRINRLIATALRDHAIKVAQEIDAALEAENKAPLGLATAVATSADNLDLCFQGYQVSEEKVATEVGEAGVERDDLERITDTLYQTYSNLGRGVENTYGRPVASRFKLTGTTPRSPDQLLTRTQTFLNLATDEALAKLPPAKHTWNTLDMVQARATLIQLESNIATAIGKITTEERHAQRARSDRNDAQAQWHRELRFAADFARAILKRGGRADLAQRLLPSAQQIDDVTLPKEPTSPDASNPPTPS